MLVHYECPYCDETWKGLARCSTHRPGGTSGGVSEGSIWTTYTVRERRADHEGCKERLEAELQRPEETEAALERYVNRSRFSWTTEEEEDEEEEEGEEETAPAHTGSRETDRPEDTSEPEDISRSEDVSRPEDPSRPEATTAALRERTIPLISRWSVSTGDFEDDESQDLKSRFARAAKLRWKKSVSRLRRAIGKGEPSSSTPAQGQLGRRRSFSFSSLSLRRGKKEAEEPPAPHAWVSAPPVPDIPSQYR